MNVKDWLTTNLMNLKKDYYKIELEIDNLLNVINGNITPMKNK